MVAGLRHMYSTSHFSHSTYHHFMFPLSLLPPVPVSPIKHLLHHSFCSLSFKLQSLLTLPISHSPTLKFSHSPIPPFSHSSTLLRTFSLSQQEHVRESQAAQKPLREQLAKQGIRVTSLNAGLHDKERQLKQLEEENEELVREEGGEKRGRGGRGGKLGGEGRGERKEESEGEGRAIML